MAKEMRRAICAMCTNKCVVNVIIEDGKIMGQEYVHREIKKASAQKWTSIVASCPRARGVAELIDHPDRINYPLRRVGERGENKWQRVTWKEALDDIASRLARIRDDYGAEAVAFNCIGENGCSDEYRARFENLFGSPNFAGQAQICYGVAAALSFVHVGGAVHFHFPNRLTRCIMLLGRNPASSTRYEWLQILDLLKQGTKLIVVDPRRTDAAMRADIWLQPRPGTDAALLLGMANVIIAEDLYDKKFVDKWCYGFDRLAARIKEYPPEKVSEITWVPADKIREAARLYATTKPATVAHGMGLEMIPNVTPTLQMRYFLPVITGNIDAPGGDMILGPNPNIILQAEIEAHDALSREQKAKMIGEKEFKLWSWDLFHRIEENIKKVQKRPLAAWWWIGGAYTPDVYRAMVTEKPYPIKALITEGANPMLTLPNARMVYEGMKKVDFHVAMDIFMTPSCLMADYVLPAACYLEKPLIYAGDFFHIVTAGEAAISPMYERKPEYYLWRELGLRLGQEKHWPWETLEDACDYRLSPLGFTLKSFIQERGGIDAPQIGHQKYEQVGFGTPTGKIELYSTIMEDMGYDPLPKYEEPTQTPVSSPRMAKDFPMIVISHRNRDLYQSQGRQIKAVRRKSPDPIAQLNPHKATELGIKDGDWIWVETLIGRAKFKCQHFSGVAPGVLSTEFGWWFPEEPAEEPSLHGVWKSNINAILDEGPDLRDQMTGAWVLRGVMCRVYRADN
jgi:thiosulfate reductase/polysulfide reductase chain A